MELVSFEEVRIVHHGRGGGKIKEREKMPVERPLPQLGEPCPTLAKLRSGSLFHRSNENERKKGRVSVNAKRHVPVSSNTLKAAATRWKHVPT